MAGRFQALKDRLGGGSGRQPPKVVFATGGSGTRAIAEVMAEAGVYLGPELNRALDSLVLKPFLKGRSQEYLAQSGWVEAVERGEAVPEPPPDLVAEMRAGLERMHEGIPSPDSMWGWKNPRTTNFLPILRVLEPEARTAHLIRDGRDMAYSKNQNQLRDSPTLIPEELRGAPEPVQSIALWSRVNLAAITFLEAHSPGGHLVILYEELCADPATHCRRLLDHLGIPVTGAVLEKAMDSVKLAASTGRWKDADPAELEAVLAAGEPALSRFGYA